ncbi:MAG: alpha/beta hydrolase [Deltaproteobacteria bacterium]|nr:alpha/beta hydrolase [Deltaproteobacteria bacterium]MBN2674432.1 alpha/beta hydrolase [Deltaproteobacteria bacterium]
MKKSFKTFLHILWPLALFLSGCIPSQATKTTRPKVDTTPWQEKTVQNTTSGNRFSYMVLPGPSEDAPVAVLLHGGIFDNRIWLYCSDLAKKYTVYAPQYPDNHLAYTGHVSDWGKVVKDFIDAVHVSPDLMVGVSNGAYGAIEYLLQNDTDVTGLVLISTVMLSSSEDEIKKRTRMGRFAMRLSPGRLQGLIEKRATGTDYGDTPGNISQSDIFYVRPYPYYYQVFRVPVTQGGKKQNTQKIKIPVLVLHGEDDEVMPLWAAKLTTDVFPNAKMIEFPGQGHDMTFSIGPRIADEILKFFK